MKLVILQPKKFHITLLSEKRATFKQKEQFKVAFKLSNPLSFTCLWFSIAKRDQYFFVVALVVEKDALL